MTRITAESANLLERTLLIDKIDIYKLGEISTSGYKTTRSRSALLHGVVSLVQTISVGQDMSEGVGESAYSIKVPSGTDISPGMMVVVIECPREPRLIGREFIIDSVSEDGLSIIRKCIAQDRSIVDHQGV